MTETFFTLTKDCAFENQHLNEGDILLILPVSAEDKVIRETFEEDNIDYRSLLSVYVYSKKDIIEVTQEDSWIFNRMPKYFICIDSSYLPDLFLELPITASEIVIDLQR